NGERFLADTVAAIDGAADVRALADAHRLYAEGRKALHQRRPSDAETALRQAQAAFGDTPMAHRARYFAAVAAFDRNRVDDAHRELEALLARVDATRHRALAADIQWQLAVWANMTGDWGAAARYADASAANFRALGETGSAAYMDATAAMPLEILGESDLAWQRRCQTFPELNEAQVATALHNAAVTLDARGETRAALSFLELLVRARGADASQLSYAYANGARYAARGGDDGRAKASLASARAHVSRVPDPAVREKIFATIGLAEATMRSSTAALDESIRFLTRGRTNIDLPDAYLQRARLRRSQRDDAGAESDLIAAMQEVETQRKTIASLESRLRFLDVAARVIEELIDLRIARGNVEGAFVVADRARVLLESAPNSGGLKPAAPPGTAIIEYAVLPRSIVAFCLTPDALTAETIAIDRRTLDARVAKFAEHVRGRRVSLSELRAESAELHRLLIAPLEKHVADAEELVLVPDGRLYAIPFAALWDGKQYLAEKYVLRFSPSAAFRRGLKTTGDSALVVADPPAANLPPLRSGREEATQIAALQSAQLLEGEQATRAAFLAAAPKHALIHFAGHANSDAITSYGALLFAPEGNDTGALGSGEIARLRLSRHPLVVLAACGTFRGDPLHVSGMSSLSRAFLTAGARGVVGTLWEIDDDVSARVFLRFHEHLRTGMTPARALRAAQIDFRHSTDPRLGHPATWAPVALLTDV
ncbi:MAG TPA: CHAT domain-containing protein, partial [Thermoanaerobaculia bacterium]|nr:CHAT domain-containing protein [Thermoanaerobaculia bacterium]